MTRFTQSPPLPARVGGWRRLAAGLAAVLMILASAAAAQVRDTLLHMQTDDFDPARRAFEAPAAFKRPAGRSAANGNEYFIVQLTAKPEKSDMTAILAAGWEPLAYVPNNSYIVRARAGSGRALSSLPRYRWSGDLEPGMKLSREVMAKYQAARAGDRVDVVVSAWPGEERKEIARAAQALGAEILRGADPYAYVARLLIRIDAARLPELAAMAEVQWIEPKANITTRNSLVASNVQSGAGTTGMTPIWDRGIHGEGQVIGHIDGELDRNHCFFRDTVNNTPGPGHRKIVGYRGSFGSDFHGTHTAGTAAGKNSDGSTANAGVAYEAKISHSSFEVLTGFGDTPTNFAARLLDAQNDGAFVHTNSWGDDGIQNYTYFCVDADTYSWNNEDALVMIASTNSSPVFTPENAKNVIAVGNTQRPPNHNNHSTGGVGPTADGRRKPELYAPGTATVSASSGTSCGTTTATGTSMASPAITGAAALVRQYYMDGFYPTGIATPATAFTPSGALVKATLMNGSVDMTGIAGYPSNLEGWGRLVLDNALAFDGETRTLYVEDKRASVGDGLAQGENQVFAVSVLDSGEPLKITLVWHDPPVARQTNDAFDVTINDLNLSVQGPGGVTYLGNVFNTTMGQSMTGGSPDPRNNVEMVQLNVPPTGGYVITVNAPTVNPMFGEQGFALVVSGALAAGQRGVVQLDASHYACGSTVAITVNDGNAGASVDVTVESASGDTENLTLTMVEEGRYTGSIVVNAGAANSGNGSLEGASGDALTVTYQDADTGEGMSEAILGAAELDCVAPALVGLPTVLETTDVSALISVEFSEPVTGDLLVDATCGGSAFVVALASVGANVYEAEVTGLTEGTLHFFRFSTTDRANNAATFDNGGSCYTFYTRVRETAFETDFEPGTSGFTSESPQGPDWTRQVDALAHSPTHLFFAPNTANVADSRLVSPAIELDANPGFLSFWHTYELEETYDGGILEITTNAGDSWQNLESFILVGGYTGTISSDFLNPLGGLDGWTGGTLGAMSEVVVDLSDFSNQTIQIRWRLGTDELIPSEGWYVDDISISKLVEAPGSNSRGAVTLSADLYGCGGTMVITVGDGNAAGATQIVTITSSAGDSETLTLNQTVQFVYGGSIALSGGGVMTGNGTLEGASGGTLTVTYTDPDTGTGMSEDISANATLDCNGPLLSAIEVLDRTNTSARLVFNSDEPVTGVALAAELCGDAGVSAMVVSEGAGVYSATFTGLSEGTVYYASITVGDEAGNMTDENNGGLCHEFNTLTRVVSFETDFEPDDSGFAADTVQGPGWVHGPDVLAHSPTNAFSVVDHTATQDARLVSPAIVLDDNPGELSFWHTFQFETGSQDFDGGVLEVSTNDGGSWQDVGLARFIAGGYNGTLSSGPNPLASRDAWVAGTLGTMTQVRVDLADFANETIRLRWRMGADGSVGEAGWLVDDIAIARLVDLGPPTAAADWNLYE